MTAADIEDDRVARTVNERVIWPEVLPVAEDDASVDSVAISCPHALSNTNNINIKKFIMDAAPKSCLTINDTSTRHGTN